MAEADNILTQRLRRQRLWGGQLDDPADVVRWLGAVQAQDYRAALWALWLRTRKSGAASIQRAYNDGQILRTHVLRPTWHFVAPEDIRWMLTLTKGRVLAASSYQYRQLGLTGDIFAKAEAVMAQALAGGTLMTRTELAARLTAAGINLDTPAGLGSISSHLMMHAELEGLVCSGPMRGKQFTYALLEERVPPAQSPADPAGELARRYVQSRAPATQSDFVWWSGLTVGEVKAGFARAQAETGPLAGTPPGYLPAYLLPNYDEFLVAYADRSAPAGDVPPDKLDARGNALFQNVILVGGRVTGTWQRTLRAKSVELQLRLFRPLLAHEQEAVEVAAARYGEYLGLAVTLHLS